MLQDLRQYRTHFIYGLFGAVIAVILMLPFFYSARPSNTGDLSGQPTFTSQRSGAFGSLSTVASSPTSMESRSSVGMGGGSGIPAMAPNTTSPAPAPDMGMSEKMIAPYYQPYTFVYKGDPLTIKDANRDVYKRVKALSAASLSSLGSLGGGLVNIGSFSNAQLRAVDIYEDRNEGYAINVNFTEGTVTISPNYEQWFTQRTALCAKGSCPPPEPISIDEVPADDALIATANAFLSSHGINTAAYGTPKVDKTWRVWYEQSTDKANYYLPESYGVIYPYVLQGHEVRDSGAGVFGLRVEVHVPDNKVFSVYNLNSQQYLTSSYATEQDTTRILKRAERGGFYGWWGGEDNTDAKQVALGTPTEVLMQFYRYDGVTNDELYVPALMFPVLDAPKDLYVPTNVVVPIIKDILDAQEQQIIMPLEGGYGIGGDMMIKSTPAGAPTTVVPPSAPMPQ